MTETLHELEHRYAPGGEDRPLAGYAALSSTYLATTAVVGALLWRRLPEEGLTGRDIVLIGVASHKVARTLTQDPVTSPIRAPFTEYAGTAGPGEVHEEVRGTGWRHAVGELVNCPFCISQWISTAFVIGLIVAPRAARTAASLMAIVTASDLLQIAYARAQEAVQ